MKFRNTTIKIKLYSAVFNLIIPETFMIKIGLVTYTWNYIDHTKIWVKLKIKEPTLNIGQKQSSDEDKGDGVDDENEEVDDEVENVEEEVSEEWAE